VSAASRSARSRSSLLAFSATWCSKTLSGQSASALSASVGKFAGAEWHHVGWRIASVRSIPSPPRELTYRVMFVHRSSHAAPLCATSVYPSE